MRLARALKLRPDVIATLQRECTAQQAVGLLWLLQGESNQMHEAWVILTPLSPFSERNRSTFQEPIREINSYLRKEVERLAEYRDEAPGQLFTAPETPHPAAGGSMEEAELEGGDSSAEASPALQPIRTQHHTAEQGVDKLKLGVSPVVTPAGPTAGPGGAPTLAQRLAASAARGGNPGQPGPSPSPMAFAQALGKGSAAGTAALPQGVWVKKSARSKGLKPLRTGEKKAAPRAPRDEEDAPTPTAQVLEGGANLMQMHEEDHLEHLEQKSQTTQETGQSGGFEHEGSFAHAEGGLPPSTAEMTFQVPHTSSVLSSLGLDTHSVSSSVGALGSLRGVSGGLSSQSAVVGSGAMLGLGGMPLGSLSGMHAGTGSMDMWGPGGGSSLSMPPPTGLGGDVPAGLLSGLESVLASPPRVTSVAVAETADVPPTVPELGVSRGESARLLLPGAAQEATRALQRTVAPPQTAALSTPPLLPRTLDFSSPTMQVQGGSVLDAGKAPAPVGRSRISTVAANIREWTRLARGGQGAVGQQLPPPILCQGSDAAVTIALAVAMEDADEVVNAVVQLCPGAQDATAAFGTPLEALAGHTPLTFLALHCELGGVAGMLLGEFAAAINTPAAFGWTPLQCAALACVLRATRGEPISARAFKSTAALLAAGAEHAQLGLDALPTAAAKVLHL